MYFSVSILIAALAAAAECALPQRPKCKPFEGDFTINQYQLYPENVGFYFTSWKLYIDQLWNASLGIYDPYTQFHQTIEFPGISHKHALNMGGTAVDGHTGRFSLVANGPLEFPTAGASIAGDRWLLSYNPISKKTAFRINLTVTSQGRYGGFQDVEHDPQGNVFVVGSFPGTLTKVSRDGKSVMPWYLPREIVPKNKGISGIAAVGWTLLAYGEASGELWKFDMRAKKGVPVVVPVIKRSHSLAPSDAIYLPPKYGGKVLLVAESMVGVSVFRSRDLRSDGAEFLGTVWLPPVDPEVMLVAPVQVGDGLYQVFVYFRDEGLEGPGTVGSKKEFPFYDITAKVDKLVNGC